MEHINVPYHTRSYQQEMFERSMKENTIVVMDTGSGKTQVAILRIAAELDTCSPDKKIWFLCPTVDLCTQQHQVLSAALPAYFHRVLTGADNVDRWSEQRIWDAALDQQRVVVSTHAVLADALRHGFVRISDLALIVFDEAHHCAKNHPANIIMRDFYHPFKKDNGSSSLPHILGLSASLIQKSNIQYMRTVEGNLDAVGVTPRKHREDLLRYVHRPTCHLLQFDSSRDHESQLASECLNELRLLIGAFSSYQTHATPNLLSDPLFSATLSITASPSAKIDESLRKFLKKSEYVYENIGSWGVDYFIEQTLNTLAKTDESDQNLFDGQVTFQQSLIQIFRRSKIRTLSGHQDSPGPHNTSSKVKSLISFLLNKTLDEPFGIVFVQQRATTAVLSALLQRHPQTRERFICAPMVGVSNTSGRRYGLSELVDLKAQRETLSNFRDGSCNLVIATNVLEEGIDVQACNMVVCFDPPGNVKSFIQRRGRARHIRSTLAILQSVNEDGDTIRRWQELEKQVSRLCQEDRERASYAQQLEEQADRPNYKLIVESTGAQLDSVATLQHLYHFCNKLPHRPYVDFRPEFHFQELESGLIQAKVVLPNFVKSHVRQATSLRGWRTERAAKEDAAFQAYKALHEASLLNDHLLPLSQDWNFNTDARGDLEFGEVPAQLDTWAEENVRTKSIEWYRMKITIDPPEALHSIGETTKAFSFTSPKNFYDIPPLLLHWATGQTFTIRFGSGSKAIQVNDDRLDSLRNVTLLLYSSVRSERIYSYPSDFVTHFEPLLETQNFEDWMQRCRKTSAEEMVEIFPMSLVRVPHQYRPPYLFRGWSSLGDDAAVKCERISKRRNFQVPFPTPTSLHPAQPLQPIAESRLEMFRAADCSFEGPPLPWARIGLFMPNILQHLQDNEIARRLQNEVLTCVPFQNRQYILTAVCAPSAKRLDNYQRLEFFGDTVLKYVTTCHLFVSEPDWHEGYLTQKRAYLVSNAMLAKASIRKGIPPYIITQEINYKDWILPTFSSAGTPPEARSLSTKLLADVVESLIGAAWVDSGIPAAIKCINVFIPELPPGFSSLDRSKRATSSDSNLLQRAQSLIGYTFNDSLILQEALTHPSCGGHSRTDSYQRLEYLGDAVLDMLVAEHLSKYTLSPGHMTHLKAALVNAHLLGFFCLNLRQRKTHLTTHSSSDGRTEVSTETRDIYLASFMAFQSSELAAARKASEHRYDVLSGSILRQIHSSAKYPWALLIRLRPEKFLSDIIESLLGAIFVDSNGNLETCSEFLKTIGLQAYMEYLLEDHVDVLSPRERVQRAVGSKVIEYDIRKQESNRLFSCRLLVNENCVAEVSDCTDNEEAIAMVAAEYEEFLTTSSAKANEGKTD